MKNFHYTNGKFFVFPLHFSEKRNWSRISHTWAPYTNPFMARKLLTTTFTWWSWISEISTTAMEKLLFCSLSERTKQNFFHYRNGKFSEIWFHQSKVLIKSFLAIYECGLLPLNRFRLQIGARCQHSRHHNFPFRKDFLKSEYTKRKSRESTLIHVELRF